MNHTPTPWKVAWKYGTHKVRRDKQDNVIVPFEDYHHAMHCVNSHAGIVKALRELIHEIEICQECGSLTDKHYIVNEALPHARKALAQAGKGE